MYFPSVTLLVCVNASTAFGFTSEGLDKFMVGNFSEYKDARSHREVIKQKGCSTAFVVAYNGAKRITVQEALMITNQKWFK